MEQALQVIFSTAFIAAVLRTATPLVLPALGGLISELGGVGNIASTIVDGSGVVRHAVSHPGTLGHQARTFRDYSYAWSDDSLLVMHSDGLATHWSFDGMPGLRRRHPAVVAAVLYREFSRRRDDVTVLVARDRR